VGHSFRGSDPARWRSQLPTYAAIVYRICTPAWTCATRASRAGSRAPGAWNPARTRRAFAGPTRRHGDRIDRAGNLPDRRGPATVVLEKAPRPGRRWPAVACRFHRYARAADGTIGFALPSGYDSTRPLILDPTLTYSTFLAGGAEDVGYSIAVGAAGAAYVAGYTFSIDFPTKGAIDPGCGTDGNCDGFAFADAFVAKLNPSLSGAASLVFSTYLEAVATTSACGSR